MYPAMPRTHSKLLFAKRVDFISSPHFLIPTICIFYGKCFSVDFLRVSEITMAKKYRKRNITNI